MKRSMSFSKETYKLNKNVLEDFIDFFWFIPSDVIQRSVEASIWRYCEFRNPVLSIGIGNGVIDSLLYKKQGVLDIGIDIDDSQFDKAKELRIYKEVLKVNAEKMPFKDKAFNTVISNSTLEHIENLKKTIAEISRVTKKNGLIFFTTPSNFLEQWIFEYEKQVDSRNANLNLKKFNERTNHINYLRLKDWDILLTGNNMEIVFHKYFISKKLLVFWYRLFKLFTTEVKGIELWSYVGHSKFSFLFPKKIIHPIEFYFLRVMLKGNLLTDEPGGQHFIVAKKK